MIEIPSDTDDEVTPPKLDEDADPNTQDRPVIWTGEIEPTLKRAQIEVVRDGVERVKNGLGYGFSLELGWHDRF